MTDKQIEAARNKLPPYMETVKLYRAHQELDCREMINSCLIYGQEYKFYDKSTYQFVDCALNYIQELGEATVRRLWQEQCDSFKKATVTWGCYSDSEGCTYNSVKWKDD